MRVDAEDGRALPRKEAADRGKALTLVNVSASTHRLLEITGLQDAFDIVDQEPGADRGR